MVSLHRTGFVSIPRGKDGVSHTQTKWIRDKRRDISRENGMLRSDVQVTLLSKDAVYVSIKPLFSLPMDMLSCLYNSFNSFFLHSPCPPPMPRGIDIQIIGIVIVTIIGIGIDAGIGRERDRDRNLNLLCARC